MKVLLGDLAIGALLIAPHQVCWLAINFDSTESQGDKKVPSGEPLKSIPERDAYVLDILIVQIPKCTNVNIVFGKAAGRTGTFPVSQASAQFSCMANAPQGGFNTPTPCEGLFEGTDL